MISFFICLALLIGGYFVYGKVVENTFAPDDRETPAVKINDGVAIIDAGGAKREISSQLIEDLEPGDYVMVHAGVAIAKITDEDDSETDQVLEDLF